MEKGKFAYEHVPSPNCNLCEALGISDERADELIAFVKGECIRLAKRMDELEIPEATAAWSYPCNTPQELAFAQYIGTRMLDNMTPADLQPSNTGKEMHERQALVELFRGLSRND